MTDAQITAIICCMLVGTFTFGFAIDFIDAGDGKIEARIDWPRALIGAALLVVAGVLTAAWWKA